MRREFHGGVVEVWDRPNLGWNFGFEQGLGYACMGETMRKDILTDNA